MDINAAFPSKYIKASDLQDREAKVVISHVDMEDIGGDNGDRKPVLYFVGKTKGLVLNRTNANMVSMIYGHDTDQWQGGEIILYPTMAEFRGKQTPAIRIKLPTRQVAPKPQPQPQPVPRVQIMKTTPSGDFVMTDVNGNPVEADPNDEIPF